MKVRLASTDDCAALAQGMKVVVDEGRWLATDSSTPVEELEDRFRLALEIDAHVLLVLEDGGTLVGALGLNPTPVNGVLSLGMWILPGWRGKGGGRMLLDAALEAKPNGTHKIELEVFPDNAAAIGLYRSMGFEEEGLRRDHYRRGDGSLRSSLVMARLFDP